MQYSDNMFSVSDYDYELPPDRIAQEPVKERDTSRLLHLCRDTGNVSHRMFGDLPDILRPSDLLVVNNTEVVPARLLGVRETGGKVEALVLDYPGKRRGDEVVCRCLIKASRRLGPGTRIIFEKMLNARVEQFSQGVYTVCFSSGIHDFEHALYSFGRVPLPPYIRRNGKSLSSCDDRSSYQTVYASEKGAVAAPTAGLHFTDRLLERLTKAGIKTVAVTLHVGHGTFLPVRVSDIREHNMHSERFSIPAATAEAINSTRDKGGRVVAVGTTVVRTLEYTALAYGGIQQAAGECDLFIYPGYEFRVVDAMITNFHLPRSTLLMLVSAFAGRETILSAYREAIEYGYRFYSYGDAMFIE